LLKRANQHCSLDLSPQSAPQIRSNPAEAKKRISEAEQRIDSTLESYVAKAYWWVGRCPCVGHSPAVAPDRAACCLHLSLVLAQ
jgi:hypothetical protein